MIARGACALLVLALLAAACEKRARDHEATDTSRAAPREPQPEPPPRPPVVVRIYCAAWAAPCQLAPELERDPVVKAALDDAGARIEQRDLTETDSPAAELATREGVDSVPTVIILKPDGAESTRFHSLPSGAELAAAIRAAR